MLINVSDVTCLKRNDSSPTEAPPAQCFCCTLHLSDGNCILLFTQAMNSVVILDLSLSLISYILSMRFKVHSEIDHVSSHLFQQSWSNVPSSHVWITLRSSWLIPPFPPERANTSMLKVRASFLCAAPYSGAWFLVALRSHCLPPLPPLLPGAAVLLEYPVLACVRARPLCLEIGFLSGPWVFSGTANFLFYFMYVHAINTNRCLWEVTKLVILYVHCVHWTCV